MRSEELRELSLFTGAGGGIYGSKILGWKTLGYVEINRYCQAVIAQRIIDGIFDKAPIFTDVRLFINLGYAKMEDSEMIGSGVNPWVGESEDSRGLVRIQPPDPLIQKLREVPSIAACYRLRRTQQQMFPGFKADRTMYLRRVKPKVAAVIDQIVREFF